MTPFPGNVFGDIIEEFDGKSKERDSHQRRRIREKNPLEAIATGDRVRIDGDQGIVEITKRESGLPADSPLWDKLVILLIHF